MGRQDVELLAIFRDRAPCDLDALAGELFGERVVGKRFGRIFLGDELLDGFADAGVRGLAAGSRVRDPDSIKQFRGARVGAKLRQRRFGAEQ